MAAALPTLRESSGRRMGIVSRRSAAARAAGERPGPFGAEEHGDALVGRRAPAGSGSASAAGVRATRVKPARTPVRWPPARAPAGSRARQHVAHRDPHRPPVEGIAAAGREQHGVEAEAAGAAEDHAEVLVVVDVLEDGDPPGAGQHVRRVRHGHRSAAARTPGDREARHRPQRRLVGQEHRRLEPGQPVAERLEPDPVDEDDRTRRPDARSRSNAWAPSATKNSCGIAAGVVTG